MLTPNLHRQIMLKILKDIYSTPSVSSILGFKGGTAAYLLHGLPRFSIDLDFDLIDSEMSEKIFTTLQKILTRYGHLEEAIQKLQTIFFLLSYQAGQHKLKLEISTRHNGPAYEIINHLGISMLVMVKSDMFAHKLVTLLERKQLASRDLFDLWYFFKQNWQPNFTLVEKRTQLPYKTYLNNCLDLINQLPPSGLLVNMGELVDARTKAWIKTHLISELDSLIRIHLDSISS